MLNFRDISINDRDWIQTALRQSGFMGCEYSFANNLAWCRGFGSRIAQFEQFYLICSFKTESGIPCFTFPAGSGDLSRVLSAMAEYAAAEKHPLIIGGLTRQSLPLLTACVPSESFSLLENRGGWDYIYDVGEFIAMSGKKFHKKRNHISQFSRYGAVFSEITPDDYDQCIALAARSYNAKDGYTDASSVAEQYAIHTFFSHFSELGLKGGLLRVDGRLAAFSVGEPLNTESFCVHIEKADLDFHGAYPAMAQQFAAHFAKDYRYLNREEDLNLPGLRKSKLSYYPAFLLEKRIAVFPEPEKLIR